MSAPIECKRGMRMSQTNFTAMLTNVNKSLRRDANLYDNPQSSFQQFVTYRLFELPCPSFCTI